MSTATTYIKRTYDFLLDDAQRDPDYREGNAFQGNPVFASASVMYGRFNDLVAVPLGDGVWHDSGATIRYSAAKDREIPNKPLCFGHLQVVGIIDAVDDVHQKLTR